MRSYTYSSSKQPRKVKRLVRSTVRADYIVCGSELEALLLESRLIKQHKPRYNVLLKKNRPRPFIKISVVESFPRVFVDYDIHEDGAKYFGPFPSLEVAQESVEIIQKLFPLRTCERPIRPNPKTRPCLEYQLERCSAPCADKISEADYRAICDDVVRLLSGRSLELLEELTQKRDTATAELRFERAARIQREIEGIGRMQLNAIHNNNLVVLCPSIESGAAAMFLIKGGKLHAQHRISLASQAILAETVSPIIAEAFSHQVPPQDITPLDLDAMNIISRWLYANQKEYRVLSLPDLSNQGTLSKMTNEVVRAIRVITCHVNH